MSLSLHHNGSVYKLNCIIFYYSEHILLIICVIIYNQATFKIEEVLK